MKATYGKDYIKEKCIKKITALEFEYNKIDLAKADRLEKEANEAISRYSKNSNEAYNKHQEGYNKAYSKAMREDQKECQAHYEARKSGHSTGSFYPTTIYPTWIPYHNGGASAMLDIDMMLLNGQKDAIRNNADVIMSKIKKLERFVRVCEDGNLTEISLDDSEISLIF